MTIISALENIHSKGLFGDHEKKDPKSLLRLSVSKNFLIVQIVKYKDSSISVKDIKIDNLGLTNEVQNVSHNINTRILWNGPNNWILVSKKKEFLNEVNETLDERNFAITDLSHSRAIIEIEGNNTKEILKKGCPYNFNELKKDNCLNSTYNGISVTIDMLGESPHKVRIFTPRSFSESLYYSITDSCLEFGYKAI
jgi:heterotetrameric sarcosine oxidase gamma subunit|tara:strand:+ start:24 stop:611 length:588 start_codon:yes stop_codon:yes gene_type:complete